MPSDKDPKNINVRSSQDDRAGGDARQASGAGGKVTLPINADQVQTDPIEGVSGRHVQHNLRDFRFLGPTPRPNMMFQGTSSTSTNPSTVNRLDTSPRTFNHGNQSLFYDGSVKTAWLANQQTVRIRTVFYPADRGIIAAFVDSGTKNVRASNALHLGRIFEEDLRQSGQPDISAHASQPSQGQVKNHPINIELRDRVPMSDDYTQFGLGSTYDDYPQPWAPYQIAEATFHVDLGPNAGDKGYVDIIHYKTLEDFEQSDVINGIYGGELKRNSPHFYDTNTSKSVTINSRSLSIDNATLNSPNMLSGVEYYSHVEGNSYSLNFDISGLFEDSFLKYGVFLRPQSGVDAGRERFEYTQYDANGVDPSNDPDAVFSSSGIAFETGNTTNNRTTGQVMTYVPELYAEDPFGRSDSANATAAARLLVNKSDRASQSPSKGDPILQEDVFYNETARIKWKQVRLNGLSVIDIGGESNGLSFDSTAPLTDPSFSSELQVRAIPSSVSSSSKKWDLIEGGELAYPRLDYSDSTTFYPSSNSGNDYTGLSGTKYYLRGFDTESPTRRGELTIVGFPADRGGGKTLWDNLQYQPDSAYEGHPDGLRIEIALPNVAGAEWRDIGKLYQEGSGVTTDVQQESDYKVVITYQTDAYTQAYQSSALSAEVYPLAYRVTVFGGSPAQTQTSPEFALYKIAWSSA